MKYEEEKLANCFVGCTCTSVDLEEVESSEDVSADCFVGCTCTSVDLEEVQENEEQGA